MNAKTGLLWPSHVENGKRQPEDGKREKWRENCDHVLILPFAFAVNGAKSLYWHKFMGDLLLVK